MGLDDELDDRGARSRRPVRLGNFTYPRYECPPAPQQNAATPRRHPVVVVGAGMVGLTVLSAFVVTGLADSVHFRLRNDGDDQSVYLQVTRGVAKRDHAFPKDAKQTVFLMSNPLTTPPAAQISDGVAAISASDFRWLKCDVKSVSLLGNCLLKQMAVDAGVAETLLFRDGKLTEASSCNVFVVKNGVLLAPPKNNLVLPGITYDVVLEIAQAREFEFEVREISEAETRDADEIWITSSTKEVLAVTSLDGKTIGDGKPGALFRRMHALYQEFKQTVMRRAA